jgi:hypothetical protein
LGARGENDFKLVQMNLEKNLRKEIQKKMEKGQALPGQPRLPFGPASGPACFPLPLSPARAAPALSQPASATWRPYAGEERAAAGHLHPPWSGRRLGLPGHSLHSVARPSPSSLRSRSAAAAIPPCAIAGESPAARRRPHQSSKLTAENTSGLAVATVSPCARSTEVRSSCAP